MVPNVQTHPISVITVCNLITCLVMIIFCGFYAWYLHRTMLPSWYSRSMNPAVFQQKDTNIYKNNTKTHSDTWRAYIQFQRDAYAIQPKQVMTVRRGRSPSKFPNPGPHQSHKIGCDMDSVALWNPAVSSQKTLFNPLVRTLACSTRLPFLYTMRLPMLCRDLSKNFSDSSVGRLSTSGPRDGRT